MTPVRLAFFDVLTVTLSGTESSIARGSRLWAPFHAEAGGERPVPSGYPTGGPEAVTDLTVDLTDLASGCAEVNRAAVAACPFPAAHAAVVEISGGAVAIPAVSGAGKSTLAAALCLAGAGYVSDEALVMDEEGCALPYPKPLALSGWSLRAVTLRPDQTQGEHGPAGGREFLLAPGDLGAVTTAPTPTAHIVLPRRGAGATRLTALPRRDGLAAIVAMGFNHYRDPRRFLRSAAAAVRAARVWRLDYDDPAAAAGALLRDLA